MKNLGPDGVKQPFMVNFHDAIKTPKCVLRLVERLHDVP